MMNKRVFYLIIILLIIISFLSVKIYLDTKKNILEEKNYLILLENKVKKIYALQNKYKFNKRLFNNLKRFCKINYAEDKYIISCKNLNSNQFNIVQNIIFKHNYKIEKFEINKNKLANLKAEITK